MKAIQDLLQGFKARQEWEAAHPQEAAVWNEALREDEEFERIRAASEAVATEAARRVAKARQRIEASGAGERALGVAAAPEETPALQAARKFLLEKGRTWLVLAGPKGTGKTVAACWALTQAAKLGETVGFRRVAEVARLSSFDSGAREIDRLKRVGFLVLDDFGAENLSDYARGLLFEILDTRHEAYARTLLTTNASADGGELQARLGERLVDRIASDGGVVLLAGASLRKRRAA